MANSVLLFLSLLAVSTAAFAKVEASFTLSGTLQCSSTAAIFGGSTSTYTGNMYDTLTVSDITLVGVDKGTEPIESRAIRINCPSTGSILDKSQQPVSYDKVIVTAWSSIPSDGKIADGLYLTFRAKAPTSNTYTDITGPIGRILKPSYAQGNSSLKTDKLPAGIELQLKIVPSEYDGKGFNRRYTATFDNSIPYGTASGGVLTVKAIFNIQIDVGVKKNRTCKNNNADKTITLPPAQASELDKGAIIKAGIVEYSLECDKNLDVYVKLYDAQEKSGTKEYLSTYYQDNPSVKSNYVFQITGKGGSVIKVNGGSLGAPTDTTNAVRLRTSSEQNTLILGGFDVSYVKKSVSGGKNEPGKIQADMIMQYLYF